MSEPPLAVTEAPPTIAAASAEIPIVAPPPAEPPHAARAPELSLDRLPPGAAVLAPQRDATRSAAVLRSMFDTVAVVLIVGGAAFAALLFSPAARNEAFKLFAI
ncbi:MAG TPA: hypothetical protein VK601_03505, partial [Kofleriaceae bacterium]|nr:hypothetical protein [Kofleriaceae bacterium]